MPIEHLTAVVWTDFRMAILLTVLIPLALLIWAFVKNANAIERLMVVYWRVSSLLGITVYLLIGGEPVGFISALIARILMPVSVWFWVDLNEEVQDMPRRNFLRLSFTVWRWALTFYSGLGIAVQIPSLRCAFLPKSVVLTDDLCRIWLNPAWGFKQLLHNSTHEEFLSFIGLLALGIYGLVFVYFLIFRLSKQGRSATGY